MKITILLDLFYYFVIIKCVYDVSLYLILVKDLIKLLERVDPFLFQSHYQNSSAGSINMRLLAREIEDPRKVPIEIRDQTKLEFQELHSRLYKCIFWIVVMLILAFSFIYYEHQPFLNSFFRTHR